MSIIPVYPVADLSVQCTVVSSRTPVPNKGPMDEEAHTWFLVLGG